MSLTPKSRIQAISAKLTPMDVEIIKTYIRGCVQGFCCNDSTKPFSVRALFGGENSDWRNTPMQRIYDYYKREGATDEEAYDRTAIDAGWLLKSVLDEDDNRFTWTDGYTKEYSLIK